jgi:hypothetical protein
MDGNLADHRDLTEATAEPARTAAPPGHAVTRDVGAHRKDRPGMADLLRHARRTSGRSPMSLVREFAWLNRGPGKLTLQEYVEYGVYDLGRYGPEEQARFITNTLHWPITRACCDMTWQAATEDKWLCSHILAQSDVRVPETLAVIDRTDRTYPATRKIATAADLRAFLGAGGSLPLFGKENRGTCSFGAFLIEEADATGLRLKGQGSIGYDAFLDDFVGATTYLLQRLETNHAFFAPYTDGLATVRACILVGDRGVEVPFAVLKLPAAGSIADSFWRPGNLACGLDVASGQVLTARSRHRFGTTDHDVHPETGAPLVGETVPMWEAVLDLVRACAPIFRPVRYQSMDIAVTPDGPVLIEINTGGGFDLPQLATGRGFLTDEVRQFFRACGYQKV